VWVLSETFYLQKLQHVLHKFIGVINNIQPSTSNKKGWNENPPVNAPTSYEKKYNILFTCQNVMRIVLIEYI
jgi:heat shock protein HspQ